jgi:tetratricopeptide (TPR) repeat protein
MSEYQEVKALVNEARKYKNKGEYEKALAVLQEGMERYPENNYLKTSLADIYYRLNRPGEAEELTEQVLRTQPENYYALSVKGNLAISRHDYNQAIRHFKQAYQLNQSPYLASRLIRAFLYNGQFEQALSLCQERLEIDPGDNRFKKIQAEIYKRMDQKDRALDTIEEYLEETEDEFALKEKIKLKLAEKTPEEAVKELKQLLRVGKYRDNHHLRTLLAEKLQETGQYPEAVATFKEALFNDPDSIYIKKNLGLTLYKAKRWEEALPYLKETLRSNPNDFYIRNTLQYVFKKLNRPQEGMEFFHQLIKETGINSLWGVYKKLAKEVERDEDQGIN